MSGPGVTPADSAASSYPVPARAVRCEIRVVNSRFIATAGPAGSVDQARAFIGRVRDEFPDATHNVPAYLIGHGASVIAHCSDDGEPSGTAGRPVLAVVRGSGMGDIVVVVTRYFGGTKLGTGGLVRAYSEAARGVLEAMPRAIRVLTHVAEMRVPYSLFERARQLVDEQGGEVLSETFAAEVTLRARFTVTRFPCFEEAMQELSRGTVEITLVETNRLTTVPARSADADPV
jgi:uncharacterized YigZ family protein